MPSQTTKDHTKAEDIANVAEDVLSDVDGVPASFTQHVETDVSDDGKASIVTTSSESTLVTPSRVEDIAKQVYADLDKQRQAKEDARAVKRNRNRINILLVALMMTFLVPFIVANVLHADSLLKYSTLIAIVPDFALTIYAYFRKY